MINIRTLVSVDCIVLGGSDVLFFQRSWRNERYLKHKHWVANVAYHFERLEKRARLHSRLVDSQPLWLFHWEKGHHLRVLWRVSFADMDAFFSLWWQLEFYRLPSIKLEKRDAFGNPITTEVTQIVPRINKWTRCQSDTINEILTFQGLKSAPS